MHEERVDIFIFFDYFFIFTVKDSCRFSYFDAAREAILRASAIVSAPARKPLAWQKRAVLIPET
jgi:hypothetical protein